MGLKKNRVVLILIASVGVISIIPMALFFYLESKTKSLEEKLVNEQELISAAPSIRRDLDSLMAIKPLLVAQTRSPIVDPILNSDRYFSKNFTGDATQGGAETVIRQKSYDLLIQTQDWVHSPILGLILDTNFLQVNHLEMFSYWSPVSTYFNGEERQQENNPIDNLGKTTESFQKPLPPNLRAMDTWVKIRLRSADYFPYLMTTNISDVYQFAILALSSQQLPLVLSGLKWLDWLRDYFEKAILSRTSPLLPVSERKDKATNFTKTVWGAAGYIDWAVKDDIFAKVFPAPEKYLADSLLLCTALNERLPGMAFEYQFLKTDYPDAFAIFKERIRSISPLCRPSSSIQKWDQTTNQGPSEKSNLLNKLSGLILRGLARPNYVEQYLTPM